MNGRISTTPRTEFERRWEAVRERLAAIGADALVILASDNILGGYNRWLSDSTVNYRKAMIVYADGLSTMVEHGAIGVRRKLDGNDPNYPGIGTLLFTASINGVHYTQAYEAELIVGDLNARGARRIAFANADALPVAFYNTLSSHFELIDDSDALDELRAVKSLAEQSEIRAAAALQDEVFAAMLPQIRPGMYEYEIVALGYHESMRRGGRYGVVAVGTAPAGQPAFFKPQERLGRRIERGDSMAILLEIASPSGFFLEVGRTAVFGECPEPMRKAWDKAKVVQAEVIDLMRAGRTGRDVYQLYLDYMDAAGVATDRRLFAHGQGYDMVERPLIREDEPMMLQSGMLLAVHPNVRSDGNFAFACDNILVTDDAPEWLHRIESKIFELAD